MFGLARSDYAPVLDRNLPASASVEVLMDAPSPDPRVERILAEHERDAIIAVLMLTVVEAKALARRQLAGQAPVPTPSPRALALLRRAQQRPDARHRSAEG